MLQRRPRLRHELQRTSQSPAATIENLRVDHRSADVAVAEQVLNDADVGSRLQKMCGERGPRIQEARGCSDMVLSVAHVVVPMKVRPDEKMPLGRNVQWPERPPKKTLTLTGRHELHGRQRQAARSRRAIFSAFR